MDKNPKLRLFLNHRELTMTSKQKEYYKQKRTTFSIDVVTVTLRSNGYLKSSLSKIQTLNAKLLFSRNIEGFLFNNLSKALNNMGKQTRAIFIRFEQTTCYVSSLSPLYFFSAPNPEMFRVVEINSTFELHVINSLWAITFSAGCMTFIHKSLMV